MPLNALVATHGTHPQQLVKHNRKPRALVEHPSFSKDSDKAIEPPLK
jgi:hypothetical protein